MSQSATPRVSVITVVKNGERYVGEALQSILAQTLTPYEIIVVDGQSTDQTAAVVRSFAAVRLIEQSNQGLANARNIGLDVAQGDWIAFLDHDDVWAADKLQIQVQAMQAQPDLAYTTTWLQFIRETDATVRPDWDATTLAQTRDGSTPSALLARRAVFEEVGRFDPAYTIGCDADWFTRARDYGVPTLSVPRVLLYKRLHQFNLSHHAALNRQEMFRIARASLLRQRRRGHA